MKTQLRVENCYGKLVGFTEVDVDWAADLATFKWKTRWGDTRALTLSIFNLYPFGWTVRGKAKELAKLIRAGLILEKKYESENRSSRGSCSVGGGTGPHLSESKSSG